MGKDKLNPEITHENWAMVHAIKVFGNHKGLNNALNHALSTYMKSEMPGVYSELEKGKKYGKC
ncbi:hypothetical protein [Methanococcus maripaludis]|uniref:Uncharacterized protein n=1 Tax=Methanococcus maripaludis TaxID=39152 RepID=A0A7J9PMJ8_METMI|nr:hypothetical protein [Methanococcus maripaludis]MBA2864004.1 hypothetical protein [Methanococcus maripaludis]